MKTLIRLLFAFVLLCNSNATTQETTKFHYLIDLTRFDSDSLYVVLGVEGVGADSLVFSSPPQRRAPTSVSTHHSML